MVVDTTDRERASALAVLKLLSGAAATVVDGGSPAEALQALGDALRAATGSELVVVRTLDADGMLAQRAVSPAAGAVAAELEGTLVDPDDATDELSDARLLAPAARAALELAGATAVLQVPALVGGRLVGVVELYHAGATFGEEDRELARLGAAHVALAVRLLASRDGQPGRESLLELVGEALGAAADGIETPRQVARLALEASGAVGALLWRSGPEEPVPIASVGLLDAGAVTSALAREALAQRQPVALHSVVSGTVATLRLGEPAGGILQLLFAEGTEPSAEAVDRLHSFAVRAAHALRASSRSLELAGELERGRALLEVVGEAIARLSLSHTLDTAVERICSLLRIERVAVYLDEGDGLATAAQRGIDGMDGSVAARLLELAQGAYRARTAIVLSQGDSDQAGAAARSALRRAGLEGAVALPLRSRDESIGLLAAYPPEGRRIAETELALLSALAAQLAVAVQNARLHEQAMELGAALGASLESERSAARRLGALYEISASFVETLRLDRTLDAVARTVVELIDVDAAVVRVPDERGETLVPQAVHIAPGPFAEAVRTILDRPHRSAVERATLLDPESAQRLGGAHALLVPFLEKGSTAAVVPLTSGKQLLAVLTVLSLDPARPITDATIDLLGSLARQAALAIDNARLYQQQTDFTDTIQRSLLPRSEPELDGVQIGAVYESAATVDVGGDVYDFLELPDGRLAVVLGDVTGHGIGATADMAMAKYVFRSLVREHPEPGELLAHANDVVTSEVVVGKFVTMAVITFDPRNGKLVAASAGHPAPRIVRTGGRIEEVVVGGIALGIDFGMTYEQASTTLEPGEAVVLFTDGVVEARLGRELYGVERLDETLASRWQLPARKLAEAVVKECRAFGGEMSDDTAVVVVKRT